MTLSERIGHHLRANVIGYLALFVALSGSAYAAKKIGTKNIKPNAIVSSLIKDGEVKSGDVADNGLTGADIDEASLQNVPVQLADGSVTTIKLADQAVTIPKLAFDPATQAELGELAAPGTINQAANPVDFSKLKNVPADFADGVDNTGAAPANNSLGAAEPPATDDQIIDGSIDAQDVDGSVAETAASQTFTGENTLTDTLTLNLFDATERLGVFAIRPGTDSTIPFALTLVNNSTAPTMHAAQITNGATSTQPTTSLLQLNNADDQAVTTGVEFPSSSGGIGTAVEASDTDIGTALDIGTNNIEANGSTISAATLQQLNSPQFRSVNVPLASFTILGVGAPDFSSGADANPDFVTVGFGAALEFDVTSGSSDSNGPRVTSTATIPPDFDSSPVFQLRVVKPTNTGAGSDGLTCQMLADGVSQVGTNTTVTGTAVQTLDYSLGGGRTAGEVAAISCQTTASTDDAIRILGAEFAYDAER